MEHKEYFPDGTPIDEWFYDLSVPTLAEMGAQYVITEYGAKSDGALYTTEIQNAIDAAYKNGGGVVVVPEGVYMTGALHFKQGVNLYIEKNGVLKGSDDISDYDLLETRIEGQTCMYFGALINADGLDGFMIGGEGTIDGNGLRSWKDAWLRWTWNKKGTNKDVQRARLVYISNCKNVIISGVTLQNSQFWTTHLYRSHHVKYIGCRILSPVEPVKAPCTDAIDIDVCTDVLVKNCYMAVNDDAVALKGGKGPYADTAPENGSNERIIIEDCEYGFCHGCLTCGSESVHNRNIIVRRIKVSENGYNLLWLKMRPDTPQHYEYITVEDISGNIQHFLNINPWTQYFDLGDRPDRPLSYADHITMRNCKCDCDIYFDVKPDREQYILSDFTLENLDITAKHNNYTDGSIDNIKIDNVVIKSL